MSYRISNVQRSSIPRNRRLRKRNNRKMIVRSKQSKKVFANRNVVSYMVPRQMPFPPRFRTTFTAGFYGFIGSAANLATGQYFAKLNSAFLPFTGGGWLNPSAALTGIIPAGYSSLCVTQLYTKIRVYASTIEIEFLPQALTDTVLCTVTPSAVTTLPANTNDAIDQPYTKQLLMSSSKMNSRNGSMIRNTISQHKFLGCTKRAIEDDLSGNYMHTYNGNPTVPFYWVVNWQTPDNVNIAVNLEYKVKMTYYVELFSDTNAIST